MQPSVEAFEIQADANIGYDIISSCPRRETYLCAVFYVCHNVHTIIFKLKWILCAIIYLFIFYLFHEPKRTTIVL